MTILFSSDDNYSQHLGVAIYSLLKNNTDDYSIRIFVVDNEITLVNKDRLNEIVATFRNAVIEFIPFKKWRDLLKLNMAWHISTSSYARLLVGSILPPNVERVLYLDCDMLVCSSLKELWDTDMHGCVVAAVQDAVPNGIKCAVDMNPKDLYFNAGMLLIDLKKWREHNCDQKCLNFIEDRNGRVIHHDQGVLNGVFRNTWHRLPLKYNLMTVHYILGRDKLIHFFKDASEFYSYDEILQAKLAPAILHFTPSFTSRPWVRSCRHPLQQLYWDILAKTPWSGNKPVKDNRKWYIRVIEWRFRIQYGN